MSFVDDLVSLKDRIDALGLREQVFIDRNEIKILFDQILSVLTEGVDLVSNVIIQGEPYPPAVLKTDNVGANQIDLSWNAAAGEVTAQWVERSDDGGGTWANITAPGDLAPGTNSYSDMTVLPEATYQYRVCAYNAVGQAKGKKEVWRLNENKAVAYPDDMVAGESGIVIMPCTSNGRIKEAGFYLENTGADGTDDLSLELDVKIGGVSIFTTKPKIDKSAADQASTFKAGTGVVEPVLDTEQIYFNAGDLISIDLSLVRTTPEEEMAGIQVVVDVEEGDQVDSDYSNMIEVTTPAT